VSEFDDLLFRVAKFEKEAHELLSVIESSPSRLISLADTHKQLGILNLKQDGLWRESLVAVEVGLFRAAMVLAWASFMDFLQEKMTADGLMRLHAEYPNWAKWKTLEDLRENLTEFAMLDAANRLKLLNKAETKALQGLLSKRSECAHPSGYQPGMNEALGYMSELLNRIPTINGRSL
jgi:hypothetical protein